MINHEKALHLYEEGKSLMDNSKISEAITKFQESAEIFPHFKTLELLGECYLNNNDLKKSIVALSSAIDLGNKPFRAHFLLAKALLTVDKTEEAKANLQKAISYNTDYKAAKDLLDTLPNP